MLSISNGKVDELIKRLRDASTVSVALDLGGHWKIEEEAADALEFLCECLDAAEARHRLSVIDECRAVIESYANEYVEKWGGTENAKTAGWAILQASARLRDIAR